MAEIFRRLETKYEVEEAEFRCLRAAVAENLPLFQFRPGRRFTSITTVYFDTENLTLFDRARRSYDDNLKLRVKEYYYPCGAGGEEEPEISPNCFVEIKERTAGEVFKRRLRIPKRLLSRLFAREDIWADLVKGASGIEFEETTRQIYWEIKTFLETYSVDPHVVVNYRREVYQENERRLRVTFDDRLRIFRPVVGLYEAVDALTRQRLGAPIRAVPKKIVEVKCPGEYPDWLNNALDSHLPRKISKFTTSVDFFRSHLKNSLPGGRGGDRSGNGRGGTT